MHVSGSSIMDKCIIHMCIIVTCIRIYISIICACIMDHGSWIHASWIDASHQPPRTARRVRPLVRNKICRIIHTCGIVKDRGSQMHHTLMHHAHIRIKNICIIHRCIRVKEEHRYMHHTCMYQDQASWIKASYTCAS